MDTLTMTDNILRAYVLADDADITDGLSWYDDARAFAAELDPTDIRRAAGVIAAMSPLTSWPLNMRRAREVYATGTTAGLSKNVAKAVAIFEGADPDVILSGDKVRSFFANIMGDPFGVTVDRHAIDVAYGRVQTDSERSAAVKRTKARDGYGMIRQAYIDAASILSKESTTITGAQLQAIVWVYWRRNVTAAFHGDAE